MAESNEKNENLKRIWNDPIGKVLCLIIFGCLTFYSMRYTEMVDEETEIPWTMVDSVGGNLLVILIVTAAILLFGKSIMNKSFEWGGRLQTEGSEYWQVLLRYMCL